MKAEDKLREWKEIKPLVIRLIQGFAVETETPDLVAHAKGLMETATSGGGKLSQLCELLGFMTAMEVGMDEFLAQSRKEN